LRTLIRITPDTTKANEAVRSGRLEKLITGAMERLHPEAAYFFADHGRRTATFICDLADQSEIPAISEPFFVELNATVEFFPCMNLEDLKRGLGRAATELRTPVGV
jgi:hypothetical protein